MDHHYLNEIPPLPVIMAGIRECHDALQEAIDEMVAQSKIYGSLDGKLQQKRARLRFEARAAVIGKGIQNPREKDIEAWIDLQVADLQEAISLAKTLKESYARAAKGHEARLNSWQTIASAFRKEIDFVRGGPR